MYIGLNAKHPFNLSDIVPTEFRKILKYINFMKIRKVKDHLFHMGGRTYRRMDGQTNIRTEGEKDRHDEANNGLSQF
jgi:hypothetical protein